MGDTEEHFRSKQYMNFLIFLMGMLALVDQYLSLIETSAIPHILEEFNIGLDKFALWQGIFGIVAFLVFVISWFADIWGRKIGILILLLIMSVSALFIGLVGATSMWVFFIFYAILILGTNVNLWAIPISEESPKEKRAMNGSVTYLIGLVPLFAFIGEPIAEKFGWPWMYGLMGIFGLFLIIPWYFMKETKRWEDDGEKFDLKDKKADYKKSIKEFTRKDWIFVIMAGLIYICWNIAFKMITTTSKIYYLNVLEFSPEKWETWYKIAGISLMLGALTIGILLEKLGRIKSLMYVSISSAIAILGLAFTTSPIFLVLTYFFLASFLGFLLVYITEMFRTKIRATALGITLTLSRIGFVVGPLIGAAVLPAIASPLELGTFQGYYVVGAIIILLPLLSLIWNKFETKNKTLEEIQVEKSDVKTE